MSNSVVAPKTDECDPRPMRKDAARNRQLLLDAARAVFAERGLDASLDDVARKAGVGVGTAYRHFANKYELASAVFDQEIDKMIDLAERVAEMDDPWEGIAVFVTSAAEAQIEDRGLREVLTSVYDQKAFELINERFQRPLNRLMNRARRGGLVRKDVRASDLGVLVMMLCTVGDFAGESHRSLWRRYVPMLLAGLTADVAVSPAALSETAFREAMAVHKSHAVAHQPAG